MARERHLNNAPIVEAIIDFRVMLSPDFDPKIFASIKENLHTKYPKVQVGHMISGSIKIKDDKPIIEPPEDMGIKGYKFTSDDGKEVAQFRIDGFTFSRLHPYTKWEQVLEEAKRLWKLYASKASPKAINRIAVHYINRLDIPSPVEDFADYLTSPPVLPSRLPQELSQYLFRLVIHENELSAGIVQTLVKSPKKKHIGIIMDIDVFKASKGGINEDGIWPTFDRLRELKNRIFFNLITEKTARLFE